MTDPRLSKLAKLLVEYSTALKRGERVLVEAIDVPDEFTIASGEITPTLKLKRRVIEARYKDQIDALYQEPHPVETAPVG